MAAFDPLSYAATNPDLFLAYGTDTGALTKHYITHGHGEGRLQGAFDPEAYAALNPDRFAVFGADIQGVTAYYIAFGRDEGRSTGYEQPAAATGAGAAAMRLDNGDDDAFGAAPALVGDTVTLTMDAGWSWPILQDGSEAPPTLGIWSTPDESQSNGIGGATGYSWMASPTPLSLPGVLA